MSKYVCDFDQVNSAGSKLCSTAAKMRSDASNYSSGIEASLSKWTGTAKDSFITSNAKQIELMNSQAEYLDSLGEFMKRAAKEIQDLDGELSTLEI